VQIVNFPQNQNNIVGASGPCPHCGALSYFKPVVGAYSEDRPREAVVVICTSAQCEACKEFVLVVGWHSRGAGNVPYNLRAVYPAGKPNENLEEGIPDNIALDFKEALRCKWVSAFKATVTMCRRAIQASCLEKKANPKKKLTEQIDEVAKNGLITESLRLFAHEVRLEGNDGAHPAPDGLDSVTEKDADDIIAFTREYLHHVYVMPQMLAKRKPSPSTTSTSVVSTTANQKP
jgi:Domain of unknown function (DUF4145)